MQNIGIYTGEADMLTYGGGCGMLVITQVRLMVLPTSTIMSGPPRILVSASKHNMTMSGELFNWALKFGS